MLSAPVVSLTVAFKSSTAVHLMYGIARRIAVCQVVARRGRRDVADRQVDADQVGIDPLHRIDIGLDRGADVATVRVRNAAQIAVLRIDRCQAAVVQPNAVEQRGHLRAERVVREADRRRRC